MEEQEEKAPPCHLCLYFICATVWSTTHCSVCFLIKICKCLTGWNGQIELYMFFSQSTLVRFNMSMRIPKFQISCMLTFSVMLTLLSTLMHTSNSALTSPRSFLFKVDQQTEVQVFSWEYIVINVFLYWFKTRFRNENNQSQVWPCLPCAFTVNSEEARVFRFTHCFSHQDSVFVEVLIRVKLSSIGPDPSNILISQVCLKPTILFQWKRRWII